jgi:hypothetical protein
VLELELLELSVKEQRAKDALREGTLVPTDQVAPTWEGYVLAAAAYMRSRASRLAAYMQVLPGVEAKREELQRSDREFLTHLGVNGEAMQVALEKFFATLPPLAVTTLYEALERARGGLEEA